MRALVLVGICALGLAASLHADESCAARADRVGSASVHWIAGPQDDFQALQQWCRAVGPPLFVPHPSGGPASPPDLEDLFYRLPDGWSGSTMRVDETFGSDHHPVIGRFTP